MGDRTGIEWTDATWNPVVGCQIVSPGCTNCYAMKMAARIEASSALTGKQTHYRGLTKPSKAGAVWTGVMREAPQEILTQPLRWRRPRRIFVNSMSDLFAEGVSDETIDKVFAVMALTPQHTYQVLTKRPARMREYFAVLAKETSEREEETCLAPARIDRIAADLVRSHCDVLDETPWPLPNVWLGVSVEDQTRAGPRVLDLMRTPAAIRFVSAEPLLARLDFGWALMRESLFVDKEDLAKAFEEEGLFAPNIEVLGSLDWVIAGGESGPGARPMHADWVRNIRDDCEFWGVPFFFKQWGDWLPMGQTMADGSISAIDRGERIGQWDESTMAARVGKRAAGRFLDGVKHLHWPKGAA